MQHSTGAALKNDTTDNFEQEEANDKKMLLMVNVNKDQTNQITGVLDRESVTFSLDRPLPEKSDIGAIFVDSGATQIEENLVRRLRSRYQDVPILLLCQPENKDIVLKEWAEGLDDFIFTPIRDEELRLRYDLHNKLGLPSSTKKTVRIADLYINHMTRSIESVEGKRKLSRTEFSILAALAQNFGSMVLKREIKRQCWGTQAVSDNALNRKIHDVRKALTEVGSNIEIKSIYGKGLILQSTKSH